MIVRSATHRARQAASRMGISPEEYLANTSAGLKRCSACKDWRPTSEFRANTSTCTMCRAGKHRIQYEPVPPDQRRSPGPSPTFRDGDKKGANTHVARAVKAGKLPRQDTVACTDCGHIGPDRKHEYDHFLGYAAEHHLCVQVVCRPCHVAREKRRGVYKQRHSATTDTAREQQRAAR